MNRFHFIFAVPLVLSFYSATLFSAMSFTQVPVMEPLGMDSSVVKFTVSEYGVVSVEILDSASGKTVRHLASGLLGNRAPAAFQNNSLSQRVAWDMRDDRGNLISGRFIAKVGLGLTALFDRSFGWNGNHSLKQMSGAATRGLAVGPDSLVYVIASNAEAGSGCRATTRIVAFRSDNGQYVRTLYPYPASLPESKLTGFGRITRTDGKKIPVVYQSHQGEIGMDMMGLARQGAAVTPDGKLLFINGGGGYTRDAGSAYPVTGNRVMVLGTDGGCPRDTFIGPRFGTQNKALFGVQAAYSAVSGKVYITGIAGKHCVYVSDVDNRGSATVFAGLETVSGADSLQFRDPRGVAVDGQGRVYIADSGNARIVVYDSNGNYLGRSACGAGLSILQMHAKSSALFALHFSIATKIAKIIKYSPYPTLAPVESVTVSTSVTNALAIPVFAVDNTRDPARIWSGKAAYDDNGTAIVPASVTLGGSDASLPMNTHWEAYNAPAYIGVDPLERFAYQGSGGVNWRKIDLTTGLVGTSTFKSHEVVVGGKDDSSIYTVTYISTDSQASAIQRYGLDEKAKEFRPGVNTVRYARAYVSGPNSGLRGTVIRPSGDIYTITHMHGHQTTDADMTRFRHFSPDGYQVDSCLIRGLETMLSPQVDSKGNLYAVYNCRPNHASYHYPETFLNNPVYFPVASTSWSYGILNYARYHMGSVFKFPLSGGSITRNALGRIGTPPATLDDSVPTYQLDYKMTEGRTVTGATWQYFGASPAAGVQGGHAMCTCVGLQMAMDRFDRLFVPDAMQFQVTVLDENKNVLLKFGEYGNSDDPQGGSVIRFGWPQFVQHAGENCYVSDLQAMRLNRIRVQSDLWAASNGLTGSAVDRSEIASRDRGFAATLFPQPVSTNLSLRLVLPVNSKVTVNLHGVDGRLIRKLHSGLLGEGNHCIRWDGLDSRGAKTANGMYAVRITADGRSRTLPFILTR